jgi:hypothetical protein
VAKITLSWTYTDTAHPDAEFRIYENGTMIIDHVGALNFTVLMDSKAPAFISIPPRPSINSHC